VTLGASRGMLANLVPRVVRFDPKQRTFGNCLVVVLTGAPYQMFRSILQGLNQSIPSLSPLAEIA
jgi:hypothetical protein